MNPTNLLLFAQIGFAALTLIFLVLLVNLLKKGIDHTQWTDEKKSRTFRTIVIGLGIWIVFVSIWSLSGMMADFSKFPFNFAPVIAVPLIGMILLIFFSKDL